MIPVAVSFSSGGALVGQPSTPEPHHPTATEHDLPPLAAAIERPLLSSDDSVWRLDKACGRTYSGRVEDISGAEGARVRTRLTALTHDLLGWAQSRLCEESKEDS
jgi:hypothetical protein